MPMNAVLHDMANASSMESDGVVSPSKLWKTSPSTVMVGGHDAGLDGVRPCSIRSVEVITLNVEPGGYAPSKASFTCWESGTLTEARTWPVEAWIATRSAGTLSPLRAASAACCTGGSTPVCTGLPGWD